MIANSSVMVIQNLVVKPKSPPVKSNFKQYQFLSNCVSSNNQWQIFQFNEKNLCCGHFCAKGIFPKNSG